MLASSQSTPARDQDAENLALARRRGAVVIAPASRTEYPGFESRQGGGFLGLYVQYCSAVVNT
jgi:hypothetical protein